MQDLLVDVSSSFFSDRCARTLVGCGGTCSGCPKHHCSCRVEAPRASAEKIHARKPKGEVQRRKNKLGTEEINTKIQKSPWFSKKLRCLIRRKKKLFKRALAS